MTRPSNRGRTDQRSCIHAIGRVARAAAARHDPRWPLRNRVPPTEARTPVHSYERGSSVKTPSDFWPVLHLLYARLVQAGPTHNARLAALTESYARLSPLARRDMLRELQAVSTALGELEPLALVEALHDGEEAPWDRGGVA